MPRDSEKRWGETACQRKEEGVSGGQAQMWHFSATRALSEDVPVLRVSSAQRQATCASTTPRGGQFPAGAAAWTDLRQAVVPFQTPKTLVDPFICSLLRRTHRPGLGWPLHSSASLLKINELCTQTGWILWYGNYNSMKLLKSKTWLLEKLYIHIYTHMSAWIYIQTYVYITDTHLLVHIYIS